MSTPFRPFRVVSKTPESATITSFYLEPVDGRPMWPAEPGQYLTLRVPTAQGELLRTYSISTNATRVDGTRITVKREAAPPGSGDVEAGKGSGWLHDTVGPGAEIEIAAPRGSFVLDRSSERPVVLLSGGVGQTPLLSMLHELARGTRDTWFVHACQNGDVHAMQDEVDALVQIAGGRLRHHVVYDSPSDADREAKRFHTEGFITREMLQSALPLDDYDCYLCGPTPFMVAQYRLLTSLGVPPGRIAYEFFGEGASLAVLAQEQEEQESLKRSVIDAGARPGSQTGSRAPASLAGLAHLTDPDARACPAIGSDSLDEAPRAIQSAGGGAAGVDARITESSTGLPQTGPSNVVGEVPQATVLFALSGVEVPWASQAGSLLELAEQAGLAPPFSCRSGICNTCQCTIREGSVEYFEEPMLTPAPGTALICCSRPVGHVVLEL